MTKLTFSTKRPKRQGTYLIYSNDEYEIVDLWYRRFARTWWISDYPSGSNTVPYSDNRGIEWGPRLGKTW